MFEVSPSWTDLVAAFPGEANLGRCARLGKSRSSSVSTTETGHPADKAPDGRNVMEIGADYSLSNDIDGEDDYSLTFSYVIREHQVTTTFGVGKHGAIFGSLLARF
jgi:hypothetical protein